MVMIINRQINDYFWYNGDDDDYDDDDDRNNAAASAAAAAATAAAAAAATAAAAAAAAAAADNSNNHNDFHNLFIVSRNGSKTHAQAATEQYMNHVLHNLSTRCDRTAQLVSLRALRSHLFFSYID